MKLTWKVARPTTGSKVERNLALLLLKTAVLEAHIVCVLSTRGEDLVIPGISPGYMELPRGATEYSPVLWGKAAYVWASKNGVRVARVANSESPSEFNPVKHCYQPGQTTLYREIPSAAMPEGIRWKGKLPDVILGSCGGWTGNTPLPLKGVPIVYMDASSSVHYVREL